MLWDSPDSPESERCVIFWQRFLTQSAVDAHISLSEYVETHADELRSEVLEFVAGVGQSIIDGRSVIEQLRLSKTYSHYWSTQFYSKLYTERANLHHAARLFALSDLLHQLRPEHLIVVTHDHRLIHAVQEIARTVSPSIRVEPDTTHTPGAGITSGNRYKRKLPRGLLAMMTLVQAIWVRLRVGAVVQPGRVQAANLLIFSYWYRFEPPSPLDGTFKSQYWGSLPNHLRRFGRDAVWCHLLPTRSFRLRLGSVRKSLSALNASGDTGTHILLDALLSFRVTATSIVDYIRLRRRAKPLVRNPWVFHHEKTGLGLAPLFAAEWDHSLRGIEAMRACITRRIMLRISEHTIKIRDLLYLYEGQPWEFALLAAFGPRPEVRVLGVAHSSVRFWDLRFYPAESEIGAMSDFSRPRPNALLVNGSLARTSLEGAHYPTAELVDVEALMYEQLQPLAPRVRKHGCPVRLLVAPDFLGHAAQLQLDLLAQSLPLLELRVEVAIKPHWNNELTNIPHGVKLLDGKKSLSRYLQDADVLYVSNITSASLDAISLGIPVLQCLDPGQFNLSPLRGHALILPVRSASDLARGIQQLAVMPAIPDSTLLTCDTDLPRWGSLLAWPQ